MIPSDFRVDEYQQLHKDLTFTPTSRLRYHYVNHGRAEKRPYLWKHVLPEEFSWQEYVEIYGLGQTNRNAVFHHYLTENSEDPHNKRRPYLWRHILPSDFSVEEYRQIHGDIEHLDAVSLRRHYVSWGRQQRRAYLWAHLLPIDFCPQIYQKVHNLNVEDAISVKRHYVQKNTPPPDWLVESCTIRNHPLLARFSSSSLYDALHRWMYGDDSYNGTTEHTKGFRIQLPDAYPHTRPIITIPDSFRETRDKIPLTIHLIGERIDELPSCYTFHVYRSPAEIRDYLRIRMGQIFLFLYDSIRSENLKYDFFSACVLYNEGGIYLRTPFWHKIFENTTDHNHHRNTPSLIEILSVNNHHHVALACPARHPIMKAYLQVLLQNIFLGIHDSLVSHISNVMIFNRVVKIFLTKSWESSRHSRIMLSQGTLCDQECTYSWRKSFLYQTNPYITHIIESQCKNFHNFHNLLAYCDKYIRPDTQEPHWVVHRLPARCNGSEDIQYRYSLVAFEDRLMREPIPKRIHKIWANGLKKDIPCDIWECIRSWETCYVGYEIIVYDEKDMESYILEHFGEFIMYIYESLIPFAFRCDFFRALVLYREGGIYTDIKQTCVQTVDVDTMDFLIIQEEHVNWQDINPLIRWPSIQNCFLMCARGHPYIKVYLDIIVQNILEQSYNACEIDITGPVALGRAVRHVQEHWSFRNRDREKCLVFDHSRNEFLGDLVICEPDYATIYVKHRGIPNRILESNKRSTYALAWCIREVYTQQFMISHNTKTVASIDFRMIGKFVAVWLDEDIGQHTSFKNLQFYQMINKEKCHTTFIVVIPVTNFSGTPIRARKNSEFVLSINNDYLCRRKFTREGVNAVFQKHPPSTIITTSDIIPPALVLRHHTKTTTTTIITKQQRPYTGRPDLYAIYFPQFHILAENNHNFYDGYTDITNLYKYITDFTNKQCIESITAMKTSYPSLDVFNLNTMLDYNLSRADIIQKQIDLCVEYGIRGFAMYWYWFSHNDVTNTHGIMDNVVNTFFFSDKVDPHDQKIFFLWANEDWTNNIALSNTDRTIKNVYQEKYMVEHIQDLMKYFMHPTYLKIDNKPVFGIHHPFFMNDQELRLWMSLLSESCLAHKFSGVHIILNSMGDCNSSDNLCQKYAINPNYKNTKIECKSFNPQFENYCIDFPGYIDHLEHFPKDQINTIAFDFDNRARFHTPNRLSNATFTQDNSDYEKKRMICRILENYRQRKPGTVENICLVNAWNEWGEKMAIEPSHDFGFYYLNLLSEFCGAPLNLPAK